MEEYPSQRRAEDAVGQHRVDAHAAQLVLRHFLPDADLDAARRVTGEVFALALLEEHLLHRADEGAVERLAQARGNLSGAGGALMNGLRSGMAAGLPALRSLAAAMVPRCRCTICWAMDSPNPKPSVLERASSTR